MKKTKRSITPAEEALITRFSPFLVAYREDLNSMFPERRWLVQQAIYALVTARNLLIYGTPGTAKSWFATTLFSGIKGKGLDGAPCRIFSIQLDGESTKSDVVGPYDMPAIDRGEWKRVVDGFLPSVHFAYLDEKFDAPALLRGLNDMLNEKELNEGLQHIKVPLMTAIAATNRSPEMIMQMYPTLDLAAYNDRWMFVSNVGPLVEDASVDIMIHNYLEGVELSATLDFADLQRIVAILNNTNMFPNLDFELFYREVIRTYQAKVRAKSWGDVFDRRIAWLTQLVEASAVCNGRTVLVPDDVLEIVYGLTPREDSDQRKLFMDIAGPLVEDANKEFADSTDTVIKKQLVRIERDVTANEKVVRPASWPANPADGGVMLQTIADLKQELQSLAPKLASTRRTIEELIARLDKLKDTVTSKY